MKTAIDSSVLLAIFNGESAGRSWLKCLMQARREGPLILCDVVYAELAPAFASEVDLQEALQKMGIGFEASVPQACWQAGQAFRLYRAAGGPREYLAPDFLIAAHAMIQADRLAAIDRGYLRRYFSDLRLLGPQT